ncbi:hypothetical protein [Chryseobacterium sp. PMSZPI]|uniref:hypothetical protein n=1 Tax=Chryseobacterium sp. PMSZPI TaxID=1033900 RepID=UPI001055DE4F|nr:hypothetical protein [Chryseobacterium sp. PMSZPI]
MSNVRFHMKTYKAIIMMLVLVFSLSPCSVKRDVLDIFDIQYISGLNKVKATSGFSVSCDANSNTSSGISISKAETKLKNKDFLYVKLIVKSPKKKTFLNEYSGHTTGNSPPKYILFKRLKLSMV